MIKVLIIEDDKVLNHTLAYNLISAGYQVISTYNFKEADSVLEQGQVDLIVLDVNLPDGNGFDLCRKWRAQIDTPIIFLTANDLESDILKGFELGAEDYITKPFLISVMLKKIAVIIKRNSGSTEKHIYNDDNLIIDFSERKASRGGNAIELSSNEYKLLKILIENSQMVLTRRLLLEKLWDCNENFVDENALTMMISRIRSKIDTKDKKHLKTIYGMGYQWMGVPDEK